MFHIYDLQNYRWRLDTCWCAHFSLCRVLKVFVKFVDHLAAVNYGIDKLSGRFRMPKRPWPVAEFSEHHRISLHCLPVSYSFFVTLSSR